MIVRYGLLERCERQTITFPAPGNGSKIGYTQFNCRPFPSRQIDSCEHNNRSFCSLWWTAGYSAELGIVFGAAAAFALVVGVTTGSRRRRVWRAVAGLVALHGTLLFILQLAVSYFAFEAFFQIVTLGMITDIYRHTKFDSFEYARPSKCNFYRVGFCSNFTGTAYVLNVFSWLFDVLIVIGVVVTGIAADAGHKWAAGNRAYTPIDG